MDAAISTAPINTGPLLVIRANAFTRRVDDGYVMQNGRRIGALMTEREIAEYILANPKTRIDFLRV